jgi:hypothetical protein
MQPIGRYTRLDKKNNSMVIFCKHCSKYIKVTDIASSLIYCPECNSEYPKLEFQVFSTEEKVEFEKKTAILKSFYCRGLKTDIFKKSYKKWFNRKNEMADYYMRSIPPPDSHNLLNFIKIASERIRPSYNIDTIGSLEDFLAKNEAVLIESWVTTLFILQQNLQAAAKGSDFDS